MKLSVSPVGRLFEPILFHIATDGARNRGFSLESRLQSGGTSVELHHLWFTCLLRGNRRVVVLDLFNYFQEII